MFVNYQAVAIPYKTIVLHYTALRLSAVNQLQVCLQYRADNSDVIHFGLALLLLALAVLTVIDTVIVVDWFTNHYTDPRKSFYKFYER